MEYVSRSKTIDRVEKGLISQYNAEINYWKNVLKRIVAVVKFLASEVLDFVVMMKSWDLKIMNA
ncbi:zinc finger MYM-type protein 1-like [Aphis craccivora]|uniref:Zinc finger MYM-type protein 1-like n=1 Tax=Aphis craccivora TaxID=307492 RepID=A0A6G0VLQ3_APHCR|nr:zinc finger MYM-type protein 1-like [Aphis craccivora]